MKPAHNRQQKRHEVQLQVRFQSAQEFVVEYAENLSLGGLYIAGAHELERLSTVKIEIQLPQFQSFHVVGRVAHLIPPELAAKLGRSPGAGIELVETPPEFDQALRSYLEWLGMRRESCVITTDPEVCDILEAAGYQASFATSPDGLDEFIASSDSSVIAVLIGPDERADYADYAELAVPLEPKKRTRGVITLVDRLLIQSKG